MADCATCGPGHPMIVLKYHRKDMTKDEMRYFLEIIQELFPENKGVRPTPRKYKDHAHWHILL